MHWLFGGFHATPKGAGGRTRTADAERGRRQGRRGGDSDAKRRPAAADQDLGAIAKRRVWRLETSAPFRSSTSGFGLRRVVSSARQAHVRFRVTVISQPTLWLNLYHDSRVEAATFAP